MCIFQLVAYVIQFLTSKKSMNSATMYSDFGLFSQYLTYMYSRLSCNKPHILVHHNLATNMQHSAQTVTCNRFTAKLLTSLHN